MRETRVSVRQRRRFRVRLGSICSFTHDVGAGGFRAELARTLPPGTPVEGSILLDGQEVAFGGQVVWAIPGDVSLNLRGRMGVRFTRIPPRFSQLLANERLR